MYLGLSFLGHPQNYKYYNITFVIFHNVIIKYCIFFHYKVVQNGPPNLAYFSLTNLYNIWSSKYCIFFPYKVVQYLVIQILHIFPLQSCTIFGHPNIAYFSLTKLYNIWSSEYCIFFPYKVVQYLVIQISAVFSAY